MIPAGPPGRGECMSEEPVTFSEDRIPFDGIEDTVTELVELYGGTVTESGDRLRRFSLPFRRGMAPAGTMECTLSWAPQDDTNAAVTLSCDRNVDAPRTQRVLLLVAGVLGSVMFLLWPFFPNEKGFGTLAWIGGAVAIAVYLMTLRRSSGGIAWDFLQRLAKRQRG